MKGRATEIEAAEALLDVGVSLPLLTFRIPFTGRRITLMRVTMRRPTLGSLVRIARLYLKLGVTYEQMEGFSARQEAEFMAEHAVTVSRMVALAVCRGPVSGLLLARPLAWVIRWTTDERYIYGAGLLFRSLVSTRSFRTIISSAQRTNPMRPRLSQSGRES